jgi:hypothetical protein
MFREKYYWRGKDAKISIGDWAFFGMLFIIFLIVMLLEVWLIIFKTYDIICFAMLLPLFFFGLCSWVFFPIKQFFIEYSEDHITITDSKQMFPYFQNKKRILNIPTIIVYSKSFEQLLISQDRTIDVVVNMSGLDESKRKDLFGLFKLNKYINFSEVENIFW